MTPPLSATPLTHPSIKGYKIAELNGQHYAANHSPPPEWQQALNALSQACADRQIRDKVREKALQDVDLRALRENLAEQWRILFES